jgi:hypothetical protein
MKRSEKSKIKAIIRNAEIPYTSLGGYPVFSLCRDGGILCPHCVKENRGQIYLAMLNRDDKQWEIEVSDINWESLDLYCDNCNEFIESAYCEDSRGIE